MNRNYFALLVATLMLAIGCTEQPATTTTPSADTTTAPATDTAKPADDTTASAPAKTAAATPAVNQPIETATAGPALTIGSKAPSLDVEHWVSDGNGAFQAVTDFEADKVYMVEFWATWCGPCVASMPHLADLQTKHKDDIQIVSISNEDLNTVTAFLERPVRDAKADGPQTYGELTSAYCLTTDPDGSTNKDYMEAAEQNGIPTSFIVGKTGLIEWIGHPMAIDEPLAKVIDGSWDRDAALAEIKVQQQFEAKMSEVYQAFQAGDKEKAFALLEKAKEGAGAEQLMQIKGMEMNIKMAPIAEKMQSGDVAGAIADMEQLVESTDGPMKANLVQILGRLKMAAEQQAQQGEEPTEDSSGDDEA